MDNYCNFIKYYKEPQYNYNVVTSSFFIIHNSYKKIDIYFNGLKNIVTNFKKIFDKNWYLRIYIDDSLDASKNHNMKNILLKYSGFIDELFHLDFVQMVKFSCDMFKNKNNSPYHYGLFGTLMRYYPLFDFNDNLHIKYSIVLDIDISVKELQFNYEMFNTIKKFNEKHPEIKPILFSSLTTLYYIKYKPRMITDDWIDGGRIRNMNYKFPKQIILSFFDLLLNNNSNIYE